MKKRKHFMTLVCLVAGFTVLSSAVYANFDNASGYVNYKNAVKNLAFSDNFTAAADVSLDADGETMMSGTMNVKLDGKNQSSYEKSQMGNYTSEHYSYQQDGTSYSYNPESNTYYTYDGGSRSTALLDKDDVTQQKAIRFAELLADTFVGNLKNNFVLVSDEDGIKEYSITLSGSQIPEVINAGLSLGFTSMHQYQYNATGYVEYEDYEYYAKSIYEKETGSSINLEDATEEDINAYYDIISDSSDKYYELLEEKDHVGIIYVKKDGSHVYYPTYEEFAAAVPSDNSSANFREEDILKRLGTDPYIDNAVCKFTLDEKGNLLSNYLEASLSGVDADGVKHSFTMKMDAKISDYGTTVADKFDPTGKTEN